MSARVNELQATATRSAVATKPPIRPSLRHVAIHVWDLPRMAQFYENVLGLVRTDQGHGGANAPVDFVFFTAEPNMHHQFVLASGRAEGATTSHLNQLSFHVESLAEVREVHRRATAEGVTGMRAVSHGNAWSVYFHDPEGNRIEVYADTPWYVPQPHGDPIDLSLTDDEIYRQTEAICRKDPAFCTKEEWERRTADRLRH